jgi:single-strand DNA-binding protein
MKTQQPLSGFIASSPQLSRTERGDPRFYARIGQEHYRREQDGTLNRLVTTFHHHDRNGRQAGPAGAHRHGHRVAENCPQTSIAKDWLAI